MTPLNSRGERALLELAAVHVGPIDDLRRYWSDPVHAAALDAERDANRAKCHAHFDAVRDRALIALGYIDARALTKEEL